MGDKTAISWADATLNPIRRRSPSGTLGHACLKVSPGCDHCYASRMQPVRFDGPEYRPADHEQISRLRADVAAGDLFLDQTVLEQALRWQKPRRIFVCSMTDLFGEWMPWTWIDQVFITALLAPQHRFLLLTKRPTRMRDYMQGARERIIGLLRTKAQEGPNNWAMWIDRAPHGVMRHISWIERWAEDPAAWPLPNVWLGVSVELDRYAWRASVLTDTPAAVRFVSAEPLLGPLPHLEDLLMPTTCERCRGHGFIYELLSTLTPLDEREPIRTRRLPCPDCEHSPVGTGMRRASRIHWIIGGGESSGPVERRLVVRCVHLTCTPEQRPLYFNLAGHCTRCDNTGWMPTADALTWARSLRDACLAGGIAFTWKQFGGPTAHAGGRLLDGRIWEQWPDGNGGIVEGAAQEAAHAL